MTATFAARAWPSSFFIAGSAATQRGRLAQLWFIKSPIISAVVFGSAVTGLISGAAGVFTLVQSSMISEAIAFEAKPLVVTPSAAITAHLIANRPPIASPPIIAACVFLLASFQPATNNPERGQICRRRVTKCIVEGFGRR